MELKILKKGSTPIRRKGSVTQSKDALERAWRDEELDKTSNESLTKDVLAGNTDVPEALRLKVLAYRKALRDYPNQPDFPNGERPVKGYE